MERVKTDSWVLNQAQSPNIPWLSGFRWLNHPTAYTKQSCGLLPSFHLRKGNGMINTCVEFFLHHQNNLQHGAICDE